MTSGHPSELELIQSALEDGEAALRTLERILWALEAARSHGRWDALGPGLTPKLLKHARLDEAEDLAEDAHEELARFGRTLRRLDPDSALRSRFEIDRLSRMSDLLWNSTLTTWLCQRGIADSFEDVNRTANELSALLDGLSDRRKVLAE